MDLVVVNYQTPDDLEAFVRSLNEHPPEVDSTLTVVDVASDASQDSFTWAAGPGRLIATEDNIGYARACNLAAADGDHDIIALFNADVVITAGALNACYNAFVNHPDWAILGPRQVDRQGRIRHAGIFGTLAAPRHRGWNEIDHGQYSDVQDAVTVAGSAYFVRRTVWEELTACPLYRDIAPDAQGAFLPTPHYYEESFASYHAHAHHHRVIYFGPAMFIHHWHRASPIGGWADQQMTTSREYFRRACTHHSIAHD